MQVRIVRYHIEYCNIMRQSDIMKMVDPWILMSSIDRT